MHILPRVLVFATLGGTVALPAQDRSTVTVAIRAENGDSLPFARVRATARGTDISTSANVRGQAVLSLPVGRVRLAVSTLGYETVEREVTIDQRPQTLQVVLRAIARQLSDVEVRAQWIGIRGGVGDETTHQPLPGAVVTTSRPALRVVTDSNGRFEIPLPKAEAVLLQIERPGYRTRPVRVEVLKDQPTDVVFFLAPGEDPRHMKVALSDLRHRMAMAKINAFTADRNQINQSKGVNLYDAIVSSGLLQKHHLTMGKSICLFVDGMARPNFPVSTIQVDDVEFIEVYGPRSEMTGTLMAEWPRSQPCTPHDIIFGSTGSGAGKRSVGIVSVRTRK